MKELIEKIASLNEAFVNDATLQSEKGTKAAGLRARKTALELMSLYKEFRKVSIEKDKA